MNWIKLFESKNSALQRLKENQPQLLIADGKRICLVYTENSFLAVSDRCTHNGESLSKGKVNFHGEVICPWHGYQFNLRTGKEWRERCADLETFPVRVEDDGIYLGI